MATPATIILTGITYLMLTPSNNPTDLRIGVARQDTAMVNKHGNAIPRHVPYISVDSSLLDGGSAQRDPDYVVTSQGSAAVTNIYLLQKETLSLGGVTTSTLTLPTSAMQTNRLPLVDYTPNIAKICPTCDLLKEADLDTPNFDHFGAVMHLKVGALAAKADAVNCIHNFPGESPKPGSDVRLTQEVAVDLEVDQLMIKTSNAELKSIVFKMGIPVTATIGSAPLEDILLVEPITHADIDQHFDLYYSILEPKKTKKHPLPKKTQDCFISEPEHHLGGANCPPLVQK
jgi:hypothetical protein